MKIKQLKYIITAFLLGLLSIFFGGGIAVNADNNSGYSNAIDDLQKDNNFNVWEYPAVPTDNKLEVIQIAESKAGELFIYVYQPSGAVADLRATCVNMALSEDVNGTDFYNLKYVNSSGVFYKYIVEGVKVSSAAERFYNITSILRKWNEDYDAPSGNDNVINEVPFEVGKLFKATTANGKVTYENVEVETILVTSKYTNHIRYKDGQSGILSFVGDYTDSHFVAFSTDKKIDKLIEADLTFVMQKRTTRIYGNGIPDKEMLIDSPITKKLTLRANDFAGNCVGGWVPSKKYTWCRIQSVSEFCLKTSLSAEAKKNVSDKQWVLRFFETDYKSYKENVTDFETIEDTKVSEVSILRLKFETNGKVYNLGVVDNKQSGYLNVAGCNGFEWWQILLLVVVCVFVLWLACKLFALLIRKLRGI